MLLKWSCYCALALLLGSGQGAYGAPSNKIGQFLFHGLQDPYSVRFDRAGHKARTLHFPAQSLGEIVIADIPDDHRDYPRGAAKGTIVVPPGKFVTFIPAHRFYLHPEIVKTLPADAFDAVWMSASTLADEEDGLCDRALAHIGHFKTLVELDLDKSDTTDAGLVFARDLPNLQKITGFQTSIEGSCFAKLAELKNLRYLRFPSTPVKDENLKNLHLLPNLQAVSFGHTGISDRGLANLSDCRKLSSLDVSDCRRVTDRSVETINSIKTLRFLNISDSGITSEGALKLQRNQLYSICWPSNRPLTKVQMLKIREHLPGVDIVFSTAHRRPVDAYTRNLFAPLR